MVPVSDRVALRIEGRGFLTILPENTTIFCVSSGGAACRVNVQGDVFGQVPAAGGHRFFPLTPGNRVKVSRDLPINIIGRFEGGGRWHWSRGTTATA